MSDAALEEYQRARRLLTLGSPEKTRESLEKLQRLDHARQHARQARLLEVGCLIRERRESHAEAMLDSLAPVLHTEWSDLVQLLNATPEGRHQNFQRYLERLGGRLRGYSPPPIPPPLPPPTASRLWDAWVVAGAVLGGCSLLTAWITVPGIPRGSMGVLPATLGVISSLLSPDRANPRFLALALSISGTLISLSLIAMELLRSRT